MTEDTRPQVCRGEGCLALIFFVQMESGKVMPLNAKADPKGNIIAVPDPRGSNFPKLGHVVRKDEDVPEDVHRFVSHFVTCPAAPAFRRSRS